MEPVNIPDKVDVRNFTHSWDNRGTSKISGVPGFAHVPYSLNFLKGFVRMDPVNIPAKFEVRSFTCSWDNRGTQKNWAVPGYTHAVFSPKFFMGLCSDKPCGYIGQIWSP